MYYSEHQRVIRMERLLEKLAYFSVALDFVVALASYYVLQGAAFSSSLLAISGDLMIVEVALTAIIFVALVAVKHYKKVEKGLKMAAFKNKYRMPHVIKRTDDLFTKARKFVANLIILLLNVTQRILY